MFRKDPVVLIVGQSKQQDLVISSNALQKQHVHARDPCHIECRKY